MDFGSNDGKFLKYMSNLKQIKLLGGIDLDSK